MVEPGAPLLEARDARIAVDDLIVVERLTCAARGDRVLCAGDTRALVAALTGVPLYAFRSHVAPPPGAVRAPPLAAAARGSASIDAGDPPGEARIVAGAIALAGADVASGAHRAISGGAPLDPPLPPGWTAEEYVGWSARLGGAPPRDARDLAAAALARVGLTSSRKRAVHALSLPERRAVILAGAMALSPSVVIIEDPLAGLEGAAAAFVLSAVAAATQGRGALLSTARLDLEGPAAVIAREASHVLVLSGGDLAFEGSLGDLAAGSRVYALVVRSDAEPLRAELAARGIVLRGGPRRFSAMLPPGTTTRDVVLAATSARVALTELLPLL
jgi:ABC-2 type transport system ATP-binding protein